MTTFSQNRRASAIPAEGGREALDLSVCAQHQDCPVREFVIDKEHRIVSTPACLLAGRISEAADGVRAVIFLS